MKIRFSLLLSAGLAAIIAVSAAGSVPGTARASDRGSDNHPVFERHPGKGHGKKHHRKKHRRHHRRHYRHHEHDHYGTVRYRVVHGHDRIIVRPAYANSFIVFERRHVVVRPVPYWVVSDRRSGVSGRLSFRVGNVDLNLHVNDHSPLYGCNFCSNRYSDYDDWEEHVVVCPRRASRHVIVERWEEDDLDYFRDQASLSFAGNDDRYEDRDDE